MTNFVSEQQWCLPGPGEDPIQVLHLRKESPFCQEGLALGRVGKSCFAPMAWDPSLRQKTFMVDINPILD